MLKRADLVLIGSEDEFVLGRGEESVTLTRADLSWLCLLSGPVALTHGGGYAQAGPEADGAKGNLP